MQAVRPLLQTMLYIILLPVEIASCLRSMHTFRLAAMLNYYRRFEEVVRELAAQQQAPAAAAAAPAPARPLAIH